VRSPRSKKAAVNSAKSGVDIVEYMPKRLNVTAQLETASSAAATAPSRRPNNSAPTR
jgi:hypothetical protein